jgi:hypothetical protein
MLASMTTNEGVRRPSAVVAARMRDARRRSGMSVPELAARCAAAGCPELTAASIHNLESRRPSAARAARPVNVDQLLCLAFALSVAPVNLLVPLDDDEPYQITPGVHERAGIARQWIRGHHPLPGTDRRVFYSQVPGGELERAEQLAKLADVSPDLFKVIAESEDA